MTYSGIAKRISGWLLTTVICRFESYCRSLPSFNPPTDRGGFF